MNRLARAGLGLACLALGAVWGTQAAAAEAPAGEPSPLTLPSPSRGEGTKESPLTLPSPSRGEGTKEPSLRPMLDAPVLFVKRFNEIGIHIYDTYYKWRPGGGIYILENPSAPPAEQKIRPLVDPTTPGTLGLGVYSKPNLSWDARHVLFCFKGVANGSTCIYEIAVDGTGLRRVADPAVTCSCYKGSGGGQHDWAPTYLPDGRILFTSTRLSGLVPCNNTGVDILHVMNADGTDLFPISVNNVNEFDPAVLPDGRILFGRWEYVDKTALTQQSLWTMFPDGTNETALYANNMVFPEAILQARPVPGSDHLVVGTFLPHNSAPRGCIAMVDPLVGKNDPAAIYNFEHPDKPTYDRGESCDPWPLSADVVLYSGRPDGSEFNALMMIDRSGHKAVIASDPAIDLRSPMLIKPRPVPPVLASEVDPKQRTGRFLVQDIYQGLTGVARGDVKWLRVVEETSRVSATPGGDQPYNQTFLVSCALAFSVKNFLGIVPVEPDGSAYFEVPTGRAVYLQALDAEGRLVQSMRTFVKASPGVTRSCIGCHEYKFDSPPSVKPMAMKQPPRRLKDESWGSGYLDYPSMVQPVLDKHCASCHGGEKGFAGGLDLTAGWTQHFSISYENLTSRRFTQLTAYLIAGIDCMNGTAFWSAQIMPPRAHGSGAAPLAQILVSGHKGWIPDLSRRERDLLLAWIDTNGLYHGTWDYAKAGCAIPSWAGTKAALAAEMQAAGCGKCHGGVFEDDWFNLERPERSRILRAPLAEGGAGLGAGLCRDRKVDPQRQRVRMLVNGYAHAVQPLEAYKALPPAPTPAEAKAAPTFASTDDPHYQKMLEIVRQGRERALAAPRVDMPGAEVIPGVCRQLVPPALPEPLPAVSVSADAEGVVHLGWERSTRTIGLAAEVYRSTRADFAPSDETRVAATQQAGATDMTVQAGVQHYAVVLVSGDERSEPIRADVTVPPPAPPGAPTGLKAVATPGAVELAWQAPAGPRVGYNVYRAKAGAAEAKRLNAEPIAEPCFNDVDTTDGTEYAYAVRAVGRRGTEGERSASVPATAKAEGKEAVFVAAFDQGADAVLPGGAAARGTLQGKAGVAGGVLDLRQGGHATFEKRPEFDLSKVGRISIECWVAIGQETQMPIVVSCGLWQKAGWFLQRFGGGWRWHVGGIDCDGGKPVAGGWTHLAATFDGHKARLFQDGALVAEKSGEAVRAPWDSPLHVGQYSGGVAPSFQLNGQIAGLKIYNRALSAEEVKAASAAKPRAKP